MSLALPLGMLVGMLRTERKQRYRLEQEGQSWIRDIVWMFKYGT